MKNVEDLSIFIEIYGNKKKQDYYRKRQRFRVDMSEVHFP